MSTVAETISLLKDLASLLREKKLVTHTGPIDLVIEQVNMWSPSQEHPLKYRLRGLEFIGIKGQYIRGDEWSDSFSLKLDADVTVTNNIFCYTDAKDLTINVQYDSVNISGQPCKGAWHLDFHNTPEPTRYMHPVYHFHHGGKKLDDLNSYGNLILLDTPRIMHHPLDIFLAIDFVISNFVFSDNWNDLRQDMRYRKMMEKAQASWWKPYYEELGDFWNNKGGKGQIAKRNVSNSKLLNPHLI